MFLVYVKDGEDNYLVDSFFDRNWAIEDVTRKNKVLLSCDMVAYLTEA